MPGMFDQWDAKKERATRPASDGPVVIPTGADLDRAQKYARAALEGEVANIQAVPVGTGRNDQLNQSAVKMGHYVAAGAIDEATVVEVLGAADGGLYGHPNTLPTIRSGLEFGKLTPAALPEPTITRYREVAPWEASNDPLDPNYVPTTTTTGSTSAAPTSTASSSDKSTSATSAAPGTSTSDPAVLIEVGKLRLRREARRLVEAEDAAREFRVPPYLPTLAAELEVPDEPVTYLVDELFPTGANVLLTAQYKSGKTTLINNLARALVDGEPFLGRYGVADLDGRVGLFNYEVSRSQYRRWLRDTQIRNTEAVAVLNLRGYSLPLHVPSVEAWVVEWLREHEVAAWVVDPFARAYIGDENENGAVGVFLNQLDIIKEKAGVAHLVMPNHTGRGEMEQGAERSRGATRLDDWADVRWILTKDQTGARYFRASGRDVETEEAALEFEPATRALRITGGDRFTAARAAAVDAVRTIITNRPGVGVSDLRVGVRQILGKADNNRIDDAIAILVSRGEIHTKRSGHTLGHWPGRVNDDPLGGV
jgi:hypothetical protein